MPRFSIVPTVSDHAPFEIWSHDAAAVLHSVARVGCGEADVLQDGAYLFSVRLGANGLWHIRQRGEAATAPIPAHE